MEDFLGILMFILYMVFAVTRNRKKGMQKDRKRKGPEPIKQVRETRVKEQPRAVKRGPETVHTIPKADKPFAEGNSYYEHVETRYGLPAQVKETAAKKDGETITETLVVSNEEQGHQPVISLDKASILQAVIWNEILQKPRSRRKPA